MCVQAEAKGPSGHVQPPRGSAGAHAAEAAEQLDADRGQQWNAPVHRLPGAPRQHGNACSNDATNDPQKHALLIAHPCPSACPHAAQKQQQRSSIAAS